MVSLEGDPCAHPCPGGFPGGEALVRASHPLRFPRRETSVSRRGQQRDSVCVVCVRDSIGQWTDDSEAECVE